MPIITFDNDKVYHLMCRTLEELQALRPLGEPYEEGDWVISDEGMWNVWIKRTEAFMSGTTRFGT